MEITINTPAKINFALKVTGQREDGYHELEMVMQTIGIYDTVTLTPSLSGEISLNVVFDQESERHGIPSGPKNLAYRAAALLKHEFNVKSGLKIRLAKRIPSSAGLGGGSSDAAAVLKGANHLWKLGLTNSELEKRGALIGADVPFFIRGGCSLVSGIGEKVTPLSRFPMLPIVVVKPPLDISTAWVYNMYDRMMQTSQDLFERDINKVVDAIQTRNDAVIPECMFNDLEHVVKHFHPEIDEISRQLIDLNALGALMSGSGSAVFGIFADENTAYNAAGRLNQKLGFKVFKTAAVGF